MEDLVFFSPGDDYRWSDEELREVGRIVSNFGTLESSVRAAVIFMTGPNAAAADHLVWRDTFSSLLTRLEDLMWLKLDDTDETAPAWKLWFDQARGVSRERNAIVHGDHYVDPESGAMAASQKQSRADKGFEIVEYSTEQLHEIAERIRAVCKDGFQLLTRLALARPLGPAVIQVDEGASFI